MDHINTPAEFSMLDSKLEQTYIIRAARVKVNEDRCPAEIEHPLRNLLTKETSLLLNFPLKLKPAAQYYSIDLMRDDTDSDVIIPLLES